MFREIHVQSYKFLLGPIVKYIVSSYLLPINNQKFKTIFTQGKYL